MKRFYVVLLAFFMFFPVVSAGWNDLGYSSPESNSGVRQGGNVTLSIVIENSGVSGDGFAVYVANVTLLPNQCINGGEAVIRAAPKVLCPVSGDIGCPARFERQTTSYEFVFENLTTSESCNNGIYSYKFLVMGNTEQATGLWAQEVRNTTVDYSLEFTGPYYCGDGICTAWKSENCTSCPEDCGECPVCTPGTRLCVNDSVHVCSETGFWELEEFCDAGCVYDEALKPKCRTPCVTGVQRCVGQNTLEVCVDKRWQNQSCDFGCLADACRGNCDKAGCPDYCENGVRYFNGNCTPVTGICDYEQEACAGACAADGVSCASTPTNGGSASNGGFDLLTTAGIVLGAALLGAAFFMIFKRVRSGRFGSA